MSEKICCVCGDRAVGFNFSALTCESCRSFFRRNAHRVQQFRCYFGNKCDVNCVSRKFCKKCRIDKCFAVGMRKESISVGNKRKKIEESIDSTTNDLSNDKIIDVFNVKTSTNSLPNCTDQRSVGIPSLIRNLIFELNELEFNRFKQLFGSTNILREPVVTANSEITTLMTALDVLKTRCDLKCRRIVKMSANISEFTELCVNDKIALLKPACPEIICLISVINYNFEGQYWNCYLDDHNAIILPISIFKLVKGNLYDAHRAFLKSLCEAYQLDVNILDLLTAIILFNPNQPNLKHRDIVRFQEKTYIYLLLRYLEIKHNSKSIAESRFLKLMNIIQELYAVNRIHVNKFVEAEPKDAGPLIEEIYDLKPGYNLDNHLSLLNNNVD